MDYNDVKQKGSIRKILKDDFQIRMLKPLGSLQMGDKTYRFKELSDNSISIESGSDAKKGVVKFSSSLAESEHKIFMETYMDRYIIICIIAPDEEQQMLVVDAEDITIASKFDEIPMYGESGVFMFGSNKGWKPKVEKVANVSGKFIFGLDEATLIHKDFQKALENPLKVKLIEMKNLTAAQIKQFSQFENLTSLKIIDSDISEIPQDWLNDFSKLEVINFANLPNLETLPLELNELLNLRRVEIIDCKNINNVFRFLSIVPSLSTVRTDLSLSKAQRGELKMKFPKLKFEEVLVWDE